MTGKELAQEIRFQLASKIKTEKLKPRLAVVLVGNDPASEKYVSLKEKACVEVGIEFDLFRADQKISQVELIKLIQKLNEDKEITGIIVQLPLPSKLNQNEILELIDPMKDVDGLTSVNLGKLQKGLPGLFPATPQGVINLLRYYQVELSGKNVVVIGRSNLVGKPLGMLLLNEDSTVTIAHSKTKDLKTLTLNADIVVAAVGKPGLVTVDMIKKDVVIVDVGTTSVDGKLVGDVDFESVSKRAACITPVPGGVGPLTIAMLLSNVVEALLIKK